MVWVIPSLVDSYISNKLIVFVKNLEHVVPYMMDVLQVC